uniref:BESS domain-containing protein n=1 Tax=Periophthalmus magnuspinnatus TaxID=409849 RepID=A0A3B4BJG4_9GOBI
MDDRLIVAVCQRPLIYNVTLADYKDRQKKDLSGKIFARLYRGKEKEKRSGSAAGSAKKWRFSGVLTFLDPFISPRPRKRTAKRRFLESPNPTFESELLTAIQDLPPLPPPPAASAQSDDEHFLLSLLPLLQKVSPHLKEYVKFQIHKLLYENSCVYINLDHSV